MVEDFVAMVGVPATRLWDVARTSRRSRAEGGGWRFDRPCFAGRWFVEVLDGHTVQVPRTDAEAAGRGLAPGHEECSPTG